MESVNILENVRLHIGDQNKVQVFHWLVDIANVVIFDSSVLSAGAGQLGEAGQQRGDPILRNLAKLSSDDSFTTTGAQ